ncbi:MAG: TonB-dependent receptor [Bacteroidaceae bacterium]|nr:TonB-dependent receptor [Bacteroidaceae bacterium]
MKSTYSLLMLLCVCTSASAQSQPDSADIYFNHLNLNEVVVSSPVGQIKRKQSATPISVVTQKALRQESSTNIIDAISRQPGMAQVTTGSGISKPVIRGLGYNRLVTIADGVRQEGQQWGDEHGIELDGQSVGQVEILKGPASLMYGSDAMAGVVIFQPQAVETEGTMAADASTEYQTNSGLIDYSLRFGGNKHGFVWNTRFSDKYAHAYKNKYDGYVPSSQFRERAASAMLGLNKDWGFSHLTLSYFHLNPSIVEGERDPETGELESSVSNLKTYAKTLPYQQIRHYKAVLDNSFALNSGLIKATIGYQLNRRQEFEDEHHHHHGHEDADEDHDHDAGEDHDHDESTSHGAASDGFPVGTHDESHAHDASSSAALDFLLHTLTYDARYVHTALDTWKLTAGIGGMYQRSQNRGEEYLIPAYDLFDFGIYATASKNLRHWTFSGGLRFDNRHLNSHSLTDDDGDALFSSFTRDLSALSASLGAVYHINKNVNLRANIARGFRAPNLSELGSNGLHHGTLRYEIGNHNLKAEHSLQADLGADYSGRYLSLEAALFINRISNYIFAQALSADAAQAMGLEALTDSYRYFSYTQGDALLKGFEAGFDLHPIHQLHIGSTFSYVDARQLHQGLDTRYLPLTPPARLTGEVKWEFIHNGDHHSSEPHHAVGHSGRHAIDHILDNLYLSLGVQHYFRQNHYYRAYGTETATPAYTLLNLSLGTDILLRGSHKLCELYVIADNLLNSAYQSHLSRLKYADINSVTGRQGIFNPGRNVTVKAIFPIRL